MPDNLKLDNKHCHKADKSIRTTIYDENINYNKSRIFKKYPIMKLLKRIIMLNDIYLLKVVP